MTPDPSLLEDIGAGSFTVAEAVAELVANSFDARVGDQKVEVEVRVNEEELWVIDNGKGMTGEELPERMKLAFKDPERSKTNKKIKGMYGLGLKTACASVGRAWGLYTKAASENETHKFELDLEQWSARRGEKNPNWEHETYSAISFPDSPLNGKTSGTAIYVRKLRGKDVLIGAIMEQLSKAYKPHLDAGDIITVNGTVLLPEPIQIQASSRIEIDAYIGPESEYHITGWLGIGSTSNDSSFGVNIYRQGQLVESWNKDWFRAHLMTSRVRGDVNLDFVPSNFHKKGVDKQSLEWRIATEFMKQALIPISKLSSDMSKNKHDPTREEKAYKAFSSHLSTIPELNQTMGANDSESVVGEQDPNHYAPSVPGAPTASTPVSVKALIRDNKLIIGSEEISLVKKTQALSSIERHWDYVFDASSAELLVVLNTTSPLYENTKDIDFYGVLAQADVITTFLTEKRGWKAKDARNTRDVWLAQHFAAQKK